MCRLDRKRQKLHKDWDDYHKTYMRKFLLCVAEAKKAKDVEQRAFSQDAFNNYLRWFGGATRLELCPSAYDDQILDEPTGFDELSNIEYNRLVREGNQTSFAPVMNFVVIFLTFILRPQNLEFVPSSHCLHSADTSPHKLTNARMYSHSLVTKVATILSGSLLR
jgi:hypothetical protein